LSWVAERISKSVGAPLAIVEKLLTIADGEEGTTIDLLLRRLMGGNEEPGLSEARLLSSIASVAERDHEEVAERRNDEIAGLEGIFGDKFRRVDGGIEVLISAPTLNKSNQLANDQIVLRVLFHSRSSYPSPTASPNDDIHLPTFYIFSSTLPSYIVLHITYLLAVQFASPDYLGLDLAKDGQGGVVNEIVAYAESIWKDVVDHPPDSRVALNLLNGATRAQNVALPITKSSGPKNQPRTRQIRPPPTMHAQLELARLLELNATKPAYKKMEVIRSGLPAWAMRERIVQLIKNNR
jgi:ATP-dependent RNA helicase DHX57